MFRSPSRALTPSDYSGIFGRGWAYRWGQRALYRIGAQEFYLAEYVRARPGERLLDVGCGPGMFRELLPDGVHYFGIDPNPAYIDSARARFGASGEFQCGYLRSGSHWDNSSFDVVMLNGVLHHVSDAEAAALLETCAQLLRVGGRFVSRDGCRYPGASLAERFILDHDRGNFIRDREGYEKLIAARFRLLRGELHKDLLRVPYPTFVAVGEKLS